MDLYLALLRLLALLLGGCGGGVEQKLERCQSRLQSVFFDGLIVVGMFQLVRSAELRAERDGFDGGGPKTRNASSRAPPALPLSGGWERPASVRLMLAG